MNSIGPKAQTKTEIQSDGFQSRGLFGLQRWDMVYVAVVLVTVLVASRVGAAVHAGQGVDSCLLGSLQVTAMVPACATAIVADRGQYASVLLGITSATRIAREQRNPGLDAWCELQSGALKAYEKRSAYSHAEQSLWLTGADAAALAAAPSVCS